MTIKVKLIGGFAILIGLVALSALIGIAELGGMNTRMNHLVEMSSAQVLLAERLQRSMLELHRAEKNLILASNDPAMETYAKQMEATEQAIATDIKALTQLTSEVGKEQIAAFEAAFTTFKEISQRVREARRKNTNQQAFALSTGDGRVLYNRAEVALRTLMERSEKEATTLRKRADEASRQVALGARTVQSLIQIYRVEKNLLLESKPASLQASEQERQEWQQKVEEGVVLLAKHSTVEAQPLLEAFRAAYAAFKGVSDRVAGLAIASTSPDESGIAWDVSTHEGQAAFVQAEAILQELVKLNEEVSNQSMITADRVALRTLLMAQCLQELIAMHRAEKDFILATSVQEMERYA
jgi:methyl-accepting chemotaxis protein